MNRFFGIESRLLDLVDAFNANGAHAKAASSPFLCSGSTFLDPNEPIDGIDGIDGFSPVPGPELFWPLLQAPGNPERTINSINSVNRFFGIENRFFDLVDAFNANGAHTTAASSPFFVLWKHVFGPH